MPVEHEVDVGSREKPLRSVCVQQNARTCRQDAILDLHRQLVRDQCFVPVVRGCPLRQSTPEVPSQTQIVEVVDGCVDTHPVLPD